MLGGAPSWTGASAITADCSSRVNSSRSEGERGASAYGPIEMGARAHVM